MFAYTVLWISLLILGKNSKNGEINSGTIIFDLDGAIQKIPYYIKDVPDLRSTPR